MAKLIDMKQLIAAVFALVVLSFGCEGQQGEIKTFKYEKDTLHTLTDVLGTWHNGSVQVQALRTVPGLSWTYVYDGDSITTNGFALLSQDSAGSLERMITDEAFREWIAGIAQDSVTSSGSSNIVTSATFVIGASTVTDSVHFACDGTADQVEIQQAIDSLPAEGGNIYLREGEYNLTASIDVPSTKKVALTGSRGAVLKSSTGGIDMISVINGSLIGFGQQEDLNISGFRIEYTGSSAGNGIYLENKHIANIEDMVFVGDSLTGIELKRTNNIKIEGCFFNRVQRGVYGVAGSTNGDDLEDISITANDFSYCGKEAINLSSTSSVWQRDVSKISIVGNNIEESDYDELYNFAIYLGRCKGAAIAGNTITQTYRGGAIELENSRLVSIIANVFRENGNNQQGGDTTSTVLLRSTDMSNIIGNTISSEFSDYGITLLSSDTNTILLNAIQIPSPDDVRQFSSNENTITIGSFDPDNAIVFTGANRHEGFNRFTGTVDFEDDVDIIGIDRLTLRQDLSTGTYFNMYSGDGGATGIKTYAHEGTFASPSATSNNQFLALWSGRGHDGTSFSSGAKGWWGIRADGTWSGSNNGSYQQWATTENGTTTADVNMELTDQGALLLENNEGFLGLHSLTTTERNNLTPRNGAIIYNETTNQIEAYENGSWVDL